MTHVKHGAHSCRAILSDKPVATCRPRKPARTDVADTDMLSIPGRPGATCDGVSPPRAAPRRRRGPARLCAREPARSSKRTAAQVGAVGAPKRDGFGKAKNFIFVFLQGGPSHLDIWDPKPDAPDNIRGDFKPIDDQDHRRASHRGHAEPRQGARQDHAHPLGQLHAGRAVQPHGRDLPDDDRLHAGQGQPVGPARAAEPQRLPVHRLRRSRGSSRRRSRCCRS